MNSLKTENSASAKGPAKRTASVAMGFVCGILAGALRQGWEPAYFLRQVGIAPEAFGDPRQRVPVERYAALYNLINRELNDESFGLFSRPMPVGSFELLTRSLAGSPILEVARLEIRETQPLGSGPTDPCRIFAFEWLLRLLHGLFSWLLGRGVVL